MNLYYIIYTSVPARPINDIELEELLRISRDANRRFEVTGMLICLPESFIQLIEGPKLYITQLYKNIKKDKRHFRVTTLHEGAIEQRFFPNWAMAFEKHDFGNTSDNYLDLQDEKVLRLFDILEN